MQLEDHFQRYNQTLIYTEIINNTELYTHTFSDSDEYLANSSSGDFGNSSGDLNINIQQYTLFYSPIHAYLCLVFAIFGVFGNLINIIVLTRENMVSSYNVILTSLAFVDMILLLPYLFGIPENSPLGVMSNSNRNYTLCVIMLVFEHITNISLAVSMWLTVVLAIFMAMTVIHPITNVRYRTVGKAILAIILTYTACILIYIPYYTDFEVYTFINYSGEEMYGIIGSKSFDIHEWVFYIPCMLVTGLTVSLIWAIFKVNKDIQRLNRRSDRDQMSEMTNKLLIVILMTFLLISVPCRVLLRFNNVLHNAMTVALFETTQFLWISKSSINFIVYMSMSSQYRVTLTDLFLKPCKCGNRELTA